MEPDTAGETAQKGKPRYEVDLMENIFDFVTRIEEANGGNEEKRYGGINDWTWLHAPTRPSS